MTEKIYQGLVRDCNQRGTFGFVSVPEFPKGVFVHKNYMPGAQSPVEGQTLKFCVEFSKGKPQARKIEVVFTPEQREKIASTASVRLNPGAKQGKPIKAKKNPLFVPDHNLPNPYTFVPVETDGAKSSAIYEVPGHAGHSVRARSSGEILLTLEALTPLLVGARQYEIDLPRDHPFRPKVSGKNRTVLEPWCISDNLGRVVIPGSSIKGMLRHYISALLNAPMERVQEQEFTYRPNLDHPKRQRPTCEFREAVVLTPPASDGEGMKIRILGPGRQAIFLQTPARKSMGVTVDDLIPKGSSFDGVFFEDALSKYRLVERSSTSSPWIANESYRVLKYFGGLNGIVDKNQMSVITRLHSNSSESNKSRAVKLYEQVLVPVAELGEKNGVYDVPSDIVLQYQRTMKSLADIEKGHSGSRNPNTRTAESQRESKSSFGSAINLECLDKNALIYVEISKNGSIQSMGHNFRYRWLYRDGTKNLNILGGSPLSRPECSLTEDEKRWADGIRERLNRRDPVPDSLGLTAARSLFGYAADEGLHGKGGFDKEHERLAGRIAVNHAIEEKKTASLKKNKRFLRGGQLVPLKELGSPKASAVEFYIQQKPKDHKTGKLTTYGDRDGDLDSKLSGRKFYRNQTQAAHDPSLYEAQNSDQERTHLATLARYAHQPGSRFRCALRFQDLSDEELGALLFVLTIHDAEKYSDLEPKVKQAIDGNAHSDNPSFALKIGHARPLGWGSVKFLISGVRLHSFKFIENLDGHDAIVGAPEDSDGWVQEKIRVFLQSAPRLSPRLLDFMNSCRFAGIDSADYPRFEREIFGFHSELRKHHSRARRDGGSETSPESVLARVKPACEK